MITLLDGRQIEESDLAFNKASYHFTLRKSGEDITNDISREDKRRIVPGFDDTKENYRLSVEKPATGGGRQASEKDLEGATTNTAEIFGRQILEEPLEAPLQTLDSGVKRVLSSSGIQQILIVSALGLGALILLKK
jgi:hypothetical protein